MVTSITLELLNYIYLPALKIWLMRPSTLCIFLSLFNFFPLINVSTKWKYLVSSLLDWSLCSPFITTSNKLDFVLLDGSLRAFLNGLTTSLTLCHCNTPATAREHNQGEHAPVTYDIHHGWRSTQCSCTTNKIPQVLWPWHSHVTISTSCLLLISWSYTSLRGHHSCLCPYHGHSHDLWLHISVPAAAHRYDYSIFLIMKLMHAYI